MKSELFYDILKILELKFLEDVIISNILVMQAFWNFIVYFCGVVSCVVTLMTVCVF